MAGDLPSLRTRALSGAVYVVVSAVCILAHKWLFVAYLALVAAISAAEYYQMMRKDHKMTVDVLGIIAAAAYPAVMLLFDLEGVALLTMVLVLAHILWFVYFMRAQMSDVGVSLFGALYTGLMLSSLVLIRQALPEPWGGVLVLLLFASIWANDTGAYLIGSKFGRHKLAPQTSPKKSWEGFIAGLVFSALVWCAMTLVPGVNMSIPMALAFGVISGAAGVVGDLSESRIKRSVGVKDSGTIMPGHGGMMDRCDSLLFSSVVSLILLMLGGCIPYV